MASVLFQIVLLDIVFSLDSVLTAVGMAEDIAVMVAAVVIAVGVMLFASGPISHFVHEHPTVKMLALSFLLLIGVTLLADGFGFHVEKGYIYAAMGFAVFVEALNSGRGGGARARPVELHPTFVKDEPADDPATPEARLAHARRPAASGITQARRGPRAYGPDVAVVVRAARLDEAERARRRAIAARVSGVERAVVASRGRRGPPPMSVAQERDPVGRLPEVRERGEAAGGADRVDRLDRPEAASAGRSPGWPVRQEPLERVLDALGVPGGDERAGDGGPAERVVAVQVVGSRMGVDRHADLAQPRDGRVEPQPARAALGRERGLERVVGRVHADPQHVELALRQRRGPRPRVTALISTAGTSVEAGGQRRARRARSARGRPARLSWSADREQPDPGVVRLARRAPRGSRTPSRAERVGVDVRDRVAGDERLAASGPGRVRAGRTTVRPRRRALIRSIWRARPVAGSMSTWQALKTTGPSPTSNRVGSALMNRGRTVLGLNPITLHDRAGHARGRSGRPCPWAGSARRP